MFNNLYLDVRNLASLLGAPKADNREKTAESSRELLEKTLGKPLPNHEVQVNFSELLFFISFVSPDFR